jgi:hypothetical protein
MSEAQPSMQVHRVQPWFFFSNQAQPFVSSKAAEHCRTPKRERQRNARNLGHVLECGAAAPLSIA